MRALTPGGARRCRRRTSRERSHWYPANNGVGARRWFVCRRAENVLARYLWDRRLRLRRFASYEAAKIEAEQQNKKQAAIDAAQARRESAPKIGGRGDSKTGLRNDRR